jgi:hypothetical protein
MVAAAHVGRCEYIVNLRRAGTGIPGATTPDKRRWRAAQNKSGSQLVTGCCSAEERMLPG